MKTFVNNKILGTKVDNNTDPNEDLTLSLIIGHQAATSA